MEQLADSIPDDQTIESKLLKILNELVENGIDMKRMNTLITNARNIIPKQVEKSPDMYFSTRMIQAALHEDLTSESLKNAVDMEPYLDLYSNWTSDQWVQFLKTYVRSIRD